MWKQGLGALATVPAFDADARDRVIRRAQRQRIRRNAVQAGAIAVIVAAISFGVVAGRGGGDDTVRPAAEPPTTTTGYVEPAGPARATIAVTTEGLKYRPDAFSVPAGIVEIRLHDGDGGQHTLTVDGAPGFRLEVEAAGQVATGKVELTPGTYRLQCTIPGHQEAGEIGTLTVTEK
jgi:plastocyanin